MRIELPDGSAKDLEEGATGADLAAAIGPGLARAALAVKVDGRVRDLAQPLVDGERVEIVTDRSPESLELIRHDTAHVLAAAVLDLYPGTKISIGPPIEDGFYYDFDFPDGVTVSEHDLAALEDKMREHVKAEEEFTREDVGVDEALARFRAEDQPYKVELIEDLVRNEGVDTVSLYTNGPFTDLCRGPHAPATGRIKAFKLLSLAGAYWRGDASRQMLTRIYGTAFHSAKDLDLFLFSELSPGSPFWQPNGMVVWNGLTELWRSENAARGYREVKTPILYDAELFKMSGHWDVYRENMYFTEVEERTMGLKPMNCPAHIQLYKDARHSYRDLPIRYSEAGLVHRHEPSGTLHGLLRVRHITQDDAHIFCTEEQIPDEVNRCLDFGYAIYDTFGFAPRIELSTRPEKRIGAEEMWDRAEAALENALVQRGVEWELNPGDGAFYGPKIDLHMTDSIGRSWQLGTVQLDYVMPERFELTYTGSDNADHRPVIIHRALMGAFERFMGILIEHYAGEFPLWLAPLQALVLPVADRHLDYAAQVAGQLAAEGLRARVDDRGESIGRKIRDAELAKVPYMLVVGDREADSHSAALRRHGEGDLGTLGLEEIAARLFAEVAERRAAA